MVGEGFYDNFWERHLGPHDHCTVYVYLQPRAGGEFAGARRVLDHIPSLPPRYGGEKRNSVYTASARRLRLIRCCPADSAFLHGSTQRTRSFRIRCVDKVRRRRVAGRCIDGWCTERCNADVQCFPEHIPIKGQSAQHDLGDRRERTIPASFCQNFDHV